VNVAEMGYEGLSCTDVALLFRLVKFSGSVGDFQVIKLVDNTEHSSVMTVIIRRGAKETLVCNCKLDLPEGH
jgi:hypothetical protein